MTLFAEITEDGWFRFLGPIAGAVVGVIGTLILRWLNRQKPKKIEVRDVELVSLLRVADTVRPRITASFDGNPVSSLSQLEMSVVNRSSDTIRQITLRFEFESTTTVLGCELSGDATAEMGIENPNVLAVSIPYLNSFAEHKDTVVAKVICDGRAERFKLSGRGEGWSAKRITGDAIVWRINFIFASLMVCIVVAASIVGPVIKRTTTVDTQSATYTIVSSLLLAVLMVPVLQRLTNWRRSISKKLGGTLTK